MEPKYVIKDDKRKRFFSLSKLWDSVSEVLNVEDSGVSGEDVDLVMRKVMDRIGGEYCVSTDRLRKEVACSLMESGHDYGAKVYVGRVVVGLVNRGVSVESAERYAADCLGDIRDRSGEG